MKILKISFLLLIVSLSFSSCEKLEEDRFNYSGSALIEFDATSLNPVLAGRTYPMLIRVPVSGRPVISASNPTLGIVADPLLTRASGTVRFRVNLMTEQLPQDQVLSYRVVATEKDAAGADVIVTTAVSGTHFTTGTSFTIPANSSFGFIDVQILNPSVASTTPRDLVLEITGNDVVKPSVNYSKLGLRIAQN